jgi:hypothetical protein
VIAALRRALPSAIASLIAAAITAGCGGTHHTHSTQKHTRAVEVESLPYTVRTHTVTTR